MRSMFLRMQAKGVRVMDVRVLRGLFTVMNEFNEIVLQVMSLFVLWLGADMANGTLVTPDFLNASYHFIIFTQ